MIYAHLCASLQMPKMPGKHTVNRLIYTYIYIYKYDSIHMIDDSPFGSPLNPFCSENIPCQGSHHGFGVDGQPVHFFCPNGHISGVNTASVVESSSA